MMHIEIKNCPFCGSEAQCYDTDRICLPDSIVTEDHRPTNYLKSVACVNTECNAEGGHADNSLEAIQKWNNRQEKG